MRYCAMCKEPLFSEQIEIFTCGGDVKYLCCDCAIKVDDYIEKFKNHS